MNSRAMDLWRRHWPHAVVLLAAALATHGVWRPAMLGGHSSAMDFGRLLALDEAVRLGDFWPRWNEAFYFGYGSALFHFYAPFSYFIAEVFLLLGFGVASALKLTAVSTLWLSAVFMLWLARELWGDFAGAAAGALYALAPYRLLDLYVRHAFGEGVAFAWLPLAMWGLLVAGRGRPVAGATAAMLGTALLLLTHNITAMLAAPALLAWWATLWLANWRRGAPLGALWRDGAWVGPGYGAAGVVLGLLAAAFFWLPAFVEKDAVWSTRSLTGGFYDYRQHFVYLKQFFEPLWKYGSSRAGPDDGMSFQLGVAHWLLLLGLPLAFWGRRGERAAVAALGFFAALLAGALFMCHAASGFVWGLSATLAFTQFPWRFLLFAAFAASLLGGAVVQAVAELPRPRLTMPVAAALLTLPFIFYARYAEAHFLLYGPDQKARYLSRPWPDFRDRLARGTYESMDNGRTADWVRTIFNRGTAEDDFLPVAVTRRPKGPPPYAVAAPSGRTPYQNHEGSNRHRAWVVLPRAGFVHLHRFWFPGWRAWVDGRPTPTQPSSQDGLVAVSVPAGEHEVRFAFVTTPLRRAAWLLSLAGVLGWLALAFGSRRRRASSPLRAPGVSSK